MVSASHIRNRGDSEALTESRVQHVQCHLIAFSSSSNRDQSLIAIVLRFVYLNYATTELSDLIDLCTTLANDCTNHIIWNKDLLRQWLARHHALYRLDRWSSVRLRSGMASLRRLLRAHASIASNGRRCAVVHWHGGLLLRYVALSIRMSISIARSWLTTVGTAVVIWMPIVTARRLGHVWHYLHPPGNNSCRPTTSGSVSRCSRSPKPL